MRKSILRRGGLGESPEKHLNRGLLNKGKPDEPKVTGGERVEGPLNRPENGKSDSEKKQERGRKKIRIR